MNKKLFLLFVPFILCLSCKKDTPLSFKAESLTEETLDLCQSQPCPEVTINYIEAIGASEVTEKINETITHFITASLLMGEDSIPVAATIRDGTSQFITAYFDDKRQFPDMAGEYMAEINVTEGYVSKQLISLELRQYTYTGGAHGYGTTFFTNIDPDTGDEIPMESLFNDLSNFQEFAERKFRAQYGIPEDENINSNGFWFDDDVFYLPQAIGFSETDLILIYNPYDIASYAQGTIEVLIPLEEASRYLTFE